MEKLKMKKYNLGVQKVDVSPGAQGNEQAIMTSMYGSKGATLGGQIGQFAGPLGQMIGSGIGMLGGAAIGNQRGKEQANEANLQRANELAVNTNIDYQNQNFGGVDKFQQKSLYDNYGYINNMDIMAKKGLKYTPKEKIEVEKDEMIFRKDPKNGKTMLVADFEGGKPHSKGGEEFLAQEGDVIYPGKMRDEIKSLIGSDGYVKNEMLFEKYRSKLPEDSESKEEFPNGTYGIDIDKIYKNVNNLKDDNGNPYGNGYTPPIIDKNLDSNGNPYGNGYIDNSKFLNAASLAGTTAKNNLESTTSNLNPNLTSAIGGIIPTVGNLMYNSALTKEKPEIRPATNLQLEKLKYEDRSNPLRNANELALKRNNQTAANYSGGSASGVLSNMYANNAAYMTQDNQIENTESQRADQVDNANAQIQNQENMTNASYFDQNVTANEGNRARTRDIQRKGQLGIANTLNDSYSNFQTLQKDKNLQIENDRQYGLKEKAYENQLKYQNEMNNNKTYGDYQWLLANKDKFVGNGAQGEEEYLQMLEMAKAKLLKSGTLKK